MHILNNKNKCVSDYIYYNCSQFINCSYKEEMMKYNTINELITEKQENILTQK